MSKKSVIISSFMSLVLMLALGMVWSYSTPSQKVVSDHAFEEHVFSENIVEYNSQKQLELLGDIQQELFQLKGEIEQLKQYDKEVVFAQSEIVDHESNLQNNQAEPVEAESHTSESEPFFLNVVNMENQHEIEEVDPSWSAIAQDSIQNVFYEKEFEGIALVNADCRSSTCKLELELNEVDSLHNFYDELGDSLGWDYDSVVNWEDESGELMKTTVYLQKVENQFDGALPEDVSENKSL